MTGLQDFAARLQRQLKERRHWAGRNRVSCFRVYEQEDSAFPFVIDLYEDRLVWAVATVTGTEDVADEVLDAAAEATGIPRDRIHLRSRPKLPAGGRFEKPAAGGLRLTVREGGLKFLVNPSDYLDTGLFLDHRWTRAYVRELAPGRKVLNLFAYTGSFTVYAAHGGAFETTSIDLSATYLDWARANLALNGLDGPAHRLLRRDAVEYLRTETKPRFDLIVLDPPTFSNSKKMDGTLDIQRDHAELIRRCLKLLAPDGLLLFSNNFRKFRLDEPALGPALVTEITPFTLPRDFRKGIHRAWLISHPDGPRPLLKKLELT